MRWARTKQRPMKKLLSPLFEERKKRGVWAIQHKLLWPQKRIRGKKNSKTKGGITWPHRFPLVFWVKWRCAFLDSPFEWAEEKKKGQICPIASRNGWISWNTGGCKSKGGLDIQRVFNLLGCLLIICGATRGNHDIESRNDQINGLNCENVKCHWWCSK